MKHWSRPFALTQHDRAHAHRSWPADAVAGPRMGAGAARALACEMARRLWVEFRTREHAIAERHGVAHVPVFVRLMGGALAGIVAFGMLGVAVLGSPADRAASAPTAIEGADSLSTLRIALPAPPRRPAPTGEQAPAETSTTAAAPAAEPAPPAARPAPTLLPTGKGMWFHLLEHTGMSPEQIVDRVRGAGLTHLYLRLGSSKKGFHGAADLDRLLPAAHAAGVKVVGWDFPYLHDPNGDIARAVEEIGYTTPDGHRIDAFSADIETGSEGVELAADRVEYYASNVRYYVGPGVPLIGTVPNACLNATFPYAELARHFDALAPMVYWITRDPGADVACNIHSLAPLGVPVMPVGQAYDPAIDNPGLVGLAPGYDHLSTFMRVAAEKGATAVSFWAWHTASDEMWQAIADAPWFSLVPMAPGHGAPDQVAVLQRLLSMYGYAVPADGQYGASTSGALTQLQADLGLAASGTLDDATILALIARG